MVNPNLQADNEANWQVWKAGSVRFCLSVCEPARNRAGLPLHHLLNLTHGWRKHIWFHLFSSLKIAIHAIPKWFNGRPYDQAVLFWDVLDGKTTNLSETARPADLFLCYFASSKNLRICMVLSWHLDIQVKIIPFKPIRKQNLMKSRNLWGAKKTRQVWITMHLPQVAHIGFHVFGVGGCRSFCWPQRERFWFSSVTFRNLWSIISLHANPPQSAKSECLMKICVLLKEEKTQSGTQAKLICEFKRT